MMKDGKALQSGTSHYFGDKFSKAYDVTFTGRDNQLHHPFQTSWGVSTRLVGAIIMTHGDDDGLILPPAVAPIQVVVVPIAAHKPGVSEKAAELAEKISKYARVKLDDSDNAPGWKFSQWEMKGVPLRLEIGPKDLEKNQCVLVHQHADGDGQRLGADIARHIQHHGLEADDDGQDSHHRLKGTHHRGHQHPEEEQSDQPGQALLDTLEDALVQIFFAGQAAQLCVIVAHLVIDQFDDILSLIHI